MDPTTPAHGEFSTSTLSPTSPTTTTSGAIHPSSLQPSIASDGTPILTTGSTGPNAPEPVSASSSGTANLSAPKSSAPASDPIAGLSGPGKAQTTSTTGSGGSASHPTPEATGIRKRLNSISQSVEGAADHPTVKNAKEVANHQLEGARAQLGRFPVVVEAEKKLGVDRLLLVVGATLLYVILIPLNLLGLALPTTQLLTFLPPSLLAIRTLDNPNEERTKTLLSYFVVFGFVQFAESLMAGFLERRIPQYYTVKLVFLAYLIHPKTKGARKIHQSVLRPLLYKSQGIHPSSNSGTQTPPSTSTRSSDASSGHRSPSGTTASATGARVSASPPVPSVGGAQDVNAPLSRASGFSGTGPSEGFSHTE